MNSELIVSTDQEGVILRQLSTDEDDLAYYQAYNASRTEIIRFDPDAKKRYRTLEDVRNARLFPTKQDKLRFGIWDGDKFVGSINMTPDDEKSDAEIGYWLDTKQTGKGYATVATQALARFASKRFNRVHAEVMKGNDESIRVLERSGFKQTAREAARLIFDYMGSSEDADIESVVKQSESSHSLPRYQGRQSWTNELRDLLNEARKRGDTRASVEIISEWTQFRRSHETDS